MTTEREEELESSFETVDHTYRSSVELDCILYDRKAEAGATYISGTAFFYAVEPLEDLLEVVFRNT